MPAEEALAVVEEGRDPAAEKAEKKANTFERVAEDYIRSTSRSGATRARPSRPSAASTAAEAALIKNAQQPDGRWRASLVSRA